MPKSNAPPALEQTNALYEELLAGFDEYLLRDRGALPSTRKLYSRHVQYFLEAKCPSGPADISQLSAMQLLDYITDHAALAQPTTTKLAATALRSFLRYLAIRGDCDLSLVDMVPTMARRKPSSLPKVLSQGQVSALLETFDPSTATGLRDHGMALCLACLGLRAGEVAQLLLDDIDWRTGSLRISTGKSRRVSSLPLLPQVGRAIAAYLRKGRPTTEDRHLFVQHKRGREMGAPLSGSAVQAVIRRAWRRSDVQVDFQGTHALRHTLATRMLHRGADLKQVADILRHKCLDTTAIYAKVDLHQLAQVAQPWLEVK